MDTVLTTFLHDGVEEIADYDSGGTLLRRYVHGPGVAEYLVMYTGTGTAGKSYFHANHQGSIVAMSDGAGTVTEQHSYDSYENLGQYTIFGKSGFENLGTNLGTDKSGDRTNLDKSGDKSVTNLGTVYLTNLGTVYLTNLGTVQIWVDKSGDSILFLCRNHHMYQLSVMGGKGVHVLCALFCNADNHPDQGLVIILGMIMG